MDATIQTDAEYYAMHSEVYARILRLERTAPDSITSATGAAPTGAARREMLGTRC